MPNTRVLTFENLYSFFVNQNKNVTFNAADDDANLVVQMPAKIIFESKSEDDDDAEGLLAVHLQANHTDTNLNGSHIEDDVCEKALNSFKNRPILGYLHKVDDEWNFWGHNMHEGDDGNIEYDEVPVGVIPESCNACLKYDEEKGKKYVEVDGYIFEEYSHASEVLQREGECSVSVELSIRELAYNAKDKYLDIKNFYYSGVTILGVDEDGRTVHPGMEGSNITLANFSKENNSNLNDINEKLDNFFERIEQLFNKGETQEDSKKGGQSQMTFEELLEKYGKTAEDVTFEYEGLEGEALEAAFVEAFGESNEDPEEGEPTQFEGESETGDTTEGEPEEGDPEDEELEDGQQFEQNPVQDNAVEFTIKKGESVKTYSLSIKEKLEALYTLIDETYGNAECEWYNVDVFEDENIVEMYGICSGKNYRQEYKLEDNTYSLVGERVEIFARYLTQEEIDELDAIKGKFELAEQELNKYKAAEAYADKMTVFEDENYAQFLDSEEFKSLMSKEVVDSLSKEELLNKAEITFAKLVKANGSFAKQENKEEQPKQERGMFAFARIEHNTSFLDGLLKK